MTLVLKLLMKKSLILVQPRTFSDEKNPAFSLFKEKTNLALLSYIEIHSISHKYTSHAIKLEVKIDG